MCRARSVSRCRSPSCKPIPSAWRSAAGRCSSILKACRSTKTSVTTATNRSKRRCCDPWSASSTQPSSCGALPSSASAATGRTTCTSRTSTSSSASRRRASSPTSPTCCWNTGCTPRASATRTRSTSISRACARCGTHAPDAACRSCVPTNCRHRASRSRASPSCIANGRGWRSGARNLVAARKHALRAMVQSPVNIENWRVLACVVRGH